MPTQRLPKLLLFALLLSALALGACTRSASTPVATAAAGSTPEGQNWQQQTMEAVRYMLLTQTAQASGATGGGEGVTPAAQTPGTPSAPVGTVVSTAGTPIVVATPTTGAPGVVPSTYTLQAGEYPFCIARRFNVDPGELMNLSGIASGDETYPGEILRIPQTGHHFPAARALRTHPTTFTVRPGDTIYVIACVFGDVDPIAIANANGLTAPYTLSAGSVINIP
jgi:LysM repeat protein